ncbi:hypothetical protein RFI_07601 [Reticulomyxa filosa]|uniref:Uncharacterized protein n=1 Tax=Reticulomyxa filosa TaxID=46433 RepID=X6NTB7_RETFI|nr:hypothetical protein RFI_07601 [Reticulomyxa filosa]|eukprot:ETO29520.1 hypothetical protein RFI_07601 [Reticulomyxa filosa]
MHKNLKRIYPISCKFINLSISLRETKIQIRTCILRLNVKNLIIFKIHRKFCETIFEVQNVISYCLNLFKKLLIKSSLKIRNYPQNTFLAKTKQVKNMELNTAQQMNNAFEPSSISSLNIIAESHSESEDEIMPDEEFARLQRSYLESDHFYVPRENIYVVNNGADTTNKCTKVGELINSNLSVKEIEQFKENIKIQEGCQSNKELKDSVQIPEKTAQAEPTHKSSSPKELIKIKSCISDCPFETNEGSILPQQPTKRI